MTAANIFFKHLFMSIKRRPAQPVLLVLVLTLAVTVCICALDINIYMPENIEKTDLAKTGSADYILSVNSKSSSRFLTEKEVEEVLPEGVECCGVFGVPTVYGEENNFAYGVSVDLEKVYTVFEVSLKKSVPLPNNKRSEGIYVTEKFAERYGTDVGGEITLTSFGKQKSFSVYGVSEKEFLGKYDVLFDARAIASILRQDSVFLSFLGDGFSPVSEIYIKTNGREAEVKEILQAKYPDMTLTTAFEKSNQTLIILDDIIALMVTIAVFFSIVVIYCCFNILSAQRREETNLFYGVGAKSYMLNWLSAAELFLYWAVAAVFGILLSLPLGRMVIDEAELSYCSVTMHPRSVAVALAVTLAATELSLALFVAGDALKKRKARKKTVKRADVENSDTVLAIVFGGVGLILTGCSLLNIYYTAKLIVAAVGFLILTVSGFFFGRKLIKIIAARAERKQKHSVPFRYACKNIRRVKTLGNTVGLVGVFLIVTAALSLLCGLGKINIDTMSRYYQGDYFVLNCSASGVEKLRATEGVEKVVRVYRGNGGMFGKQYTLLYFDDEDAVSELIPIERLPENNEIFLAKAFAAKFQLEVGDTVEVTIGNETYTLKNVYITNTTLTSALFNAEALGLSCDTLLIIGKEGYDSETVYKNIMETLGYESATVVSKKEYMNNSIGMVSSYIFCAEILLVFVVIFAVIGMADNIAASYRSRREEFLCYESSGMSKKDIRKMKGAEIGLCIGVGALIFAMYCIPLAVCINQACESFMVSLWLNIKAWLMITFHLV